MINDNHGHGQNAGARFGTYVADSLPGRSVEDGKCIRSAAYFHPDGSLTAAKAAAYAAQGFEVALQVSTNCSDDCTPSSLESFFASQQGTLALRWRSSLVTAPAPFTPGYVTSRRAAFPGCKRQRPRPGRPNAFGEAVRHAIGQDRRRSPFEFGYTQNLWDGKLLSGNSEEMGYGQGAV